MKRPGERGNVFFTLFAAAALVGVVSASTVTLTRGPLGTAVAINNKVKADSQIQIASKLAILAASQQDNSGDCDEDGSVEPLPPKPAAGGPVPTGGGHMPDEIGAAKADPWGTPYGYCAWNHGALTSDPLCPGLLEGTNDPAANGQPVFAIISAGPSRQFHSVCADHDQYVAIDPDGDDIVTTFTYAEAVKGSGGLWHLKSSEPGTATIDKDVEVGSGRLRLGTEELWADQPGFDAAVTCLGPQHVNSLRYNPFINAVEVCDFDGGYEWKEVMRSDSLWALHANAEDIFYMDGNVGIGTTSPQALLHLLRESGSQVLTMEGPPDAGAHGTLTSRGGNSVFNLGSPDGNSSISRLHTDADKSQWWNFQAYGAATAASRNLGIRRWDGTAYSEMLYITAGGNVGIGTTSPEGVLDVVQGTTPSFIRRADWQGFEFRTNAGGNTIKAFSSDTATKNWFFDLDTSGSSSGSRSFRFRINEDEKMRIAYDGRVGIGTASPLARLHIQEGDGDAIRIRGSGNTGFALRSNTAGHNEIISYNSEPLALIGGNVGIGTTSPTSKLHVTGATTLDSTLDVTLPVGTTGTRTVRFGFEDTANYLRILTYGSGHATLPNRVLIDNIANESGQTGGYIDFRPEANFMRFYASGGSDGTFQFFAGGSERIRVNANGYVGIGTGTPNSRLQVNGTVALGSSNTPSGNSSTDAYFLGPSNTVSDGGGGSNTFFFFGRGNTITDGGAGSNTSIAIGNNVSIGNGTIALGFGSNTFRITESGAFSVSSLTSCGGLQTNASGVFSCTSDEHLKDVHGPFAAGLQEVLRITPQTYSWKENTEYFDDGVRYPGFIAQNVEQALPDAVTTGADGYKQVNTTPILAALINATKEQQTLIDQLHAANDNLRADNDDLRQRLERLETAMQR